MTIHPPRRRGQPETRLLTGPARGIRAIGSTRTVAGYAVVWDAPSLDLGGFVETFKRGAFTKALKAGADVRALVNHDPSLILGRLKAGTLRLAEDSKGLRAEIDLPESPLGDTYLTAVERGDIDGMSFRFWVVAEAWSERGNQSLRTVTEADIDDVSIVAYPAYPASSVQVKLPTLSGRAAPPKIGAHADRLRRLRLIELELQFDREKASKLGRHVDRLRRLRLAEAGF